MKMNMIVKALGESGDKRAVEPLINVIKQMKIKPKGAIPLSGKSTIVALGELGDKRAVDTILDFLENKKIGGIEFRKAAVLALGKIGDDSERVLQRLMIEEARTRTPTEKFNPLRSPAYQKYRNVILETLNEFQSFKERDSEIIIKLIKAAKSEKSIEFSIETLSGLPPIEVGAAFEQLELYDDADEWYTSNGLLEDAARARKKKAEMGSAKISQKIVHGDEVTKTEVKDSVINRSNVGGDSSKMEEIEKLANMKEKGIIDDDEFKQMKKEILEK